MKIKEGADLYPLVYYNYTKINDTYSKDLASFENGDVIIQIIVNPSIVKEDIILNTSIGGVEIDGDRFDHFFAEYYIDFWILLDEIEILRSLEVIE